ncbi:hypothetical protein FQR65_LT09287 [Abscondita terminalis]|nr:hypothetical protein FQR65_LT09287 [Abscondita terminalis]
MNLCPKSLFRLYLLRSNLVKFKHIHTNMPSIHTIAVCQFTATNNKEHNFKVVENLVKYAYEQKAKMVFLPEATDFIGINDSDSKKFSEPLDGPLMSSYKEMASQYKLWLSIGGFHEVQCTPDNMVYYNSHVVISDTGDIKAVYRKLHLFDAYLPDKEVTLKESNTISPGSEIIPPVSTSVGNIGLMICYDLRFPELSIVLKKLGANILTFPSAFTVPTGEAHWETLLKARAIENQCYVIAAAQYGVHNEKRKSFGQSLVIDPWGKIIAQAPKYTPKISTHQNVILAAIDQNMQKHVHDRMPVYNHRRDDLYQLVPTTISLTNLPSDFLFSEKVIPNSVVFYCTPYSYAFTNIRCVVPGHVLVASRRPAKRLGDLSISEANDFIQTTIKVQKLVENVYKAKSSTVCVQDGPEAGQTVAHVHCHILPRKSGDFPHNDDVYVALARHDKRDKEPMRTLEEMSEEATLLRNNL